MFLNKSKTCDDFSRLVRCSAGFAYAHFQNRFIGGAPIILAKSRDQDANLRFEAPWEFIEENHIPGRLGLTQKDSASVQEHISACQTPICKEAYERIRILARILNKGSDLEAVKLASAFHGKHNKEPLWLSADKGWEESIKVLEPVFKWFTGEGRRDFI
jgi:hypothetical protein